jgi:tetratricopeptide (TPR) repeat protein
MEKFGFEAMKKKAPVLHLLCRWLNAVFLLCFFTTITIAQPTYILELFNQKDYAGCIIQSNNYLLNHPGDTNVLMLRAKSRYYSGEINSCINDLQNLKQLVKNHAEIKNYLGLCFIKQGDYKFARNAFIEAIDIDPKQYQYHYNLGYVYVLSNKWTAAIEAFTACLKLNPNLLDALVNRAFAYSMHKQFELSLQDYNEAIKLEPNRTDLLIKRAMVLISLKKNRQAVQTLMLARNIDPNNAHIFYNLGRAYFQLKDFYKSVCYLDTAISIQPNMEVALFNRGVAWLELSMSNTHKACDDFSKAAKLGYGEAWEFLNKYCK